MRTVLVIEDNTDNMKIITYALQRAGYTVIAAGSGEEGFELVLKERPLFILMDINLPGMDGLETTKKIRSSESDGSIPIIAITSYAMSGDRERILAAGCNGYFEKPIDPITIVEQIHMLLGKMAKWNEQ
jgi:two-component system, cell cycle response regulator DivK